MSSATTATTPTVGAFLADIERRLGDRCDSVRRAAAADPGLRSTRYLDALLADPDFEIQLGAAQNPNLCDAQVDRTVALLDDAWPQTAGIRTLRSLLTAAATTSDPVEEIGAVGTVLSASFGRMDLIRARHTEFAEAAMWRVLRSDDEDLIVYALTFADVVDIVEPMMRRAFEHHRCRVASTIARDPRLPADLVAQASQDEDWLVRDAAARREDLSLDLLDRLLDDPVRSVLVSARRSPSAPVWALPWLAHGWLASVVVALAEADVVDVACPVSAYEMEAFVLMAAIGRSPDECRARS